MDTTTGSWRRATVVALCVCAAASFGCKDEPEEKKEEPVVEVEDERPNARMNAFGLPLPPRVTRVIQRNDHYVVVETDMSIDERADFLEEALPNHEVLRLSLRLHAVALDQSLPEVRASYRSGRRSSVVVRYRASRYVEVGMDDGKAPVVKGPTVAGAVGADDGGPIDSRGKMLYRPKKGTPVKLKTPDGKLLAPGAKWYEPYYPPKGSPLYNDKSNWGRPFGEWDPG